MRILRHASLGLTLAVLALLGSLANFSGTLAGDARSLMATPTTATCSPVQEQNFDVVQISPDGKYLLTVLSLFKDFLLSSSEVRLWSIETGKLIFVLKDPSIERFSALDISPDSKYALIGPSMQGARSRLVTLWSIPAGGKLQTIRLKGPTNYLDRNARFSLDGKYIFTTDHRGAYLWDIARLVQHRSFSPSDNGKPETTRAAKISPDGKQVFTVSSQIGQDGYAVNVKRGRIWDVKTGKQLHLFDELVFFEGEIYPFYSPDSKYMVIPISENYTLWDTQNFTQVSRLSDYLDRSIEFEVFSPDSRYVLGRKYPSSTSMIVEAKTGKIILSFEAEGPQAEARFFSDSKKVIFAEKEDLDQYTVFSVRDILSGKELWNFRIADGYNPSLLYQLTPNDENIVTGLMSNRVRVWDVKTGKLIREFC